MRDAIVWVSFAACGAMFMAQSRKSRRLMRLMGLMPIYQKTRTSIPHPEHKRYPYLLRDLNIAGPNHVWRADKVCCRKRLRGEGKSMVYDRYENFKNISIMKQI